jgi:hypothetical protein
VKVNENGHNVTAKKLFADMSQKLDAAQASSESLEDIMKIGHLVITNFQDWAILFLKTFLEPESKIPCYCYNE